MPSNHSIYLDHNATTPMLASVKDAMMSLFGQPLNPSSVHASGRQAHAIIENARRNVLALVGAKEGYEAVFTSTGTEANNLAIKGTGRTRVLASSIEHPSVLLNKEITNRIPVDAHGIVSLEALEKLLRLSTEKTLISVMMANNETGIVQPIKEICELAHRFGALVHTDAVQAAGKLAIDVFALGADFITLSAHKIGGPQGVGALIIRKNTDIAAQMIGGGQEKRRRAGTENVAAIHGFGMAASHALKALPAYQAHVHLLRTQLEAGIASIAKDAVIFGKNVERLGNTSYVALPHVDGNTQLIRFDMQNIAISAGSACSSGKVTMSHVLDAMNIDPKLAKNAIRVSLGTTTTIDDIEAFLAVFKNITQSNTQKTSEGVAA